MVTPLERTSRVDLILKVRIPSCPVASYETKMARFERIGIRLFGGKLPR